MPLLEDLLYITSVASGQAPGAKPDTSAVQQSKLVALSKLADELRRYDESGDAASLRAFKAKTAAQADLLRAQSAVLSAGVRGAGAENVAAISAASREAVARMQAYTRVVNEGYDATYGAIIGRIMQETGTFPPGAETARARWDAFIQRVDSQQPGLNRGVQQAMRSFGQPTVSGDNQAKWGSIQKTAADQSQKEQQSLRAIEAAGSTRSGTVSLEAAKQAFDLLQQAYGGLSPGAPAPGETVESTAQKEASEKNLERIQSAYDRLAADVFGGPTDKYGGLTEEQWKGVINSPKFQRFARQYGFDVGRVTPEGEYVAGRQDMRAVNAMIRAEQGRAVFGTPRRMQETYVKLDVAGDNSDPSELMWEDGKYRVDPQTGAYLTEEQAAALAPPSSGDKFLFTDNKGNGYVQHADGSIDWLNPGSGSTTPIRDADGKWVKGDPKKMQANFDADVARQKAAGLDFRPVADATSKELLDGAEVARRVAREGGLDTITDEVEVRAPALVTGKPPTGSHAVYGLLLPHKPSDDDDTVRIRTKGGTRTLRRQDDPQTGKSVWTPVEGPPVVSLGDGATVLAGGGRRTTFRDAEQARRGALDEQTARSLEPGKTRLDVRGLVARQKAAPGDQPERLDEGSLRRAARPDAPELKDASTTQRAAPTPPPPAHVLPEGVQPGSPEALQAIKQQRLDAVKAALVATMSGTPTRPPERPAASPNPTPGQAAGQAASSVIQAGGTIREAARAAGTVMEQAGYDKRAATVDALQKLRAQKRAQQTNSTVQE